MVYYPYKQTIWSEDLAKIYDRQSRQLEEHHANLREVDKQRQEKQQSESLVKVFGKIAEFSQAAGTAYKEHKAKKAGEKLEFNKDFLNLVRTNPEFKSNLEKIYEENKHDTVKLGEKLEAFIKSERENGRFDKVKYLDRFNPKKMLQTREAVAIALAPTAIGDIAWDTHVLGLKNVTDEERAAYKNNPGNRDKWAKGELANISNNEPFATKFLFEEYDRKTSTNKNVRQIRDAAELNRLTEARSDAVLKTSGTSLKPKIFAENIFTEVTSEINSGKYTQEEDGLTVQEQAVEAVVQRIEKIGIRGAIPYSALTGLEEKLTAAGSITQSYFSKDGDHYNRIVRAVNVGQGRWLAGEKVNDQQFYAQLQLRYLQGDEANKDRDIQYLRNRNLLPKEQIDKLEQTNIADQSEDVFTVEDNKYNKLEQSGDLHLKIEELKNHKNDKIREKYLPLAQEADEWLKTNPNDFSVAALESEVFSMRTGGSYEKPSDLNQEDHFVIGKLKEVSYTSLYKYLRLKKAGQNIENIGVLMLRDKEAFWTANGGGVKIKKNDDTTPPGMFSLKQDVNNNYQWANVRKTSLDVNPDYNHTYTNPNQAAAYEAKVKYFGNISKEERFEMVGGIYTKDQILGFIKNGFFNKDMKDAAARDGLLPGEALNLAVDAIIKNDKDFATRHNLAKWQVGKEKEPTLDVRINDGLLTALEQLDGTSQGTVIKQLQSLMRWRGFDSLTMNQRKRVYKILSSVSPVTEGLDPISAQTQQLRARGMSEEDIKEWWQLYHDKRMRESVEGGALDLQNIPIG